MIKVLFNEFEKAELQPRKGRRWDKVIVKFILRAQAGLEALCKDTAAACWLGGWVQVGAGGMPWAVGHCQPGHIFTILCLPPSTPPTMVPELPPARQRSPSPALGTGRASCPGLGSVVPVPSASYANELHPHQRRPLLPDSEGRADKWTSVGAR